MLSDTELIDSIIKTNGISKVVHLVSTMVPGSTFEHYTDEFEHVIFPTIKLMQLCSKVNIQFVYFSSGGTVYGNRKSLESFEETDPKEPISYYGLSKQMIENSIQFEHRVSNLEYLILRPSNPYGHGQRIFGKQGLIAVSIGKILTGGVINVWGDGTSIRDYIYIDDLVKIVSQIFDSGVKNATINIGSGKGYSVNSIISILKGIVSENVNVIYTTERKADVSNMILNNTLLNSIVDIEFTTLKQGITDFYLSEKKKLNHD